jgi:hypothetical protein
MRTWSTLCGEIDAKIAAPSISPTRWISQCTESPRSGLTKNADGSIAKDMEPSRSTIY